MTGPFTLSPLPYDADALEPTISAKTVVMMQIRPVVAMMCQIAELVSNRPKLSKPNLGTVRLSDNNFPRG